MSETAAPGLQALMRELGGADPRMAMLMQFLQPQQARPVADEPGLDERNAVIEDLSARLDAAEDRLQRMDTIARRLHTLHQAASARLAELAAALGACGLCWGDNDQCPGCRGRGRAGMVRPDPEVRARILSGRPAPRPQRVPTPTAQQGEE